MTHFQYVPITLKELTQSSELFASQILGDDLPVLFCHMKTMPIPNDERIAYLYRSVNQGLQARPYSALTSCADYRRHSA